MFEQPHNLEQFMLTQQHIQLQNMVNSLTHDRRLGYKRGIKTLQIYSGYNKVMALVNKFKV